MSKSNEKRNSKNTKLRLFPYDYIEKDKYTDDDRLSIHIWCLDENSKPHLIRIDDFPVMCYLELPPERWSGDPREHVLKTNKLVNYLSRKLESDGYNKIIGHTMQKRRKVYYYKGNHSEVPMLLLKFKNNRDRKQCEFYLKMGIMVKEVGRFQTKAKQGFSMNKTDIRMWEQEISNVRKLLTSRAMSYSQWMDIEATKVEEAYKLSKIEHEYIGNWKTMFPVSSEISDTLQVYPKIMAFDIECYSHDENRFPDAWECKDVTYMISFIVQICGKPETRKRYAIIAGSYSRIPKSKLDGSIVYSVVAKPGEYTIDIAIINKMAEIIQEEDPEIVTGYNIFGFDYAYLGSKWKSVFPHESSLNNNVYWPIMGRLMEEKSLMVNTTWSSGAYGQNDFSDLKMAGRINVDLLPIIKRDYKLLKYSLDYVSNYFLGTSKHNITAKDMFWIYEKLNTSEEKLEELKKSESKSCMENIIRSLKAYEELMDPYVFQDKSVLFDLYQNREKILLDFDVPQNHQELLNIEKWKEITNSLRCDLEKDGGVPNSEVNDILLSVITYLLSTVMMTFVLLYCFQDSDLVIDLFDRLNTFIGLVQMSQVTGVTIVELFTRGQQIKCMSLLYDLAAHRNFVIDHNAQEGYNYTGGFVYTPKKGIHENVICWDFASLYPTIIMAYNIDHTTLVHPEIVHLVPDECCNIITFDQEEISITKDEYGRKTSKPITKSYKFKFLNENKTGLKGLIPELEHEMVTERRKVKKWLKEEKDPVMRIVYHNRQLALKIVCNSFYGFLGVKKGGKLPLMEAAMSITAKARESILKVSSYIEEKYNGNVVYGDTDSVMASLNIDDPKEVISEGYRLEKELTALFPPPMEMEMEKIMRIICLKKKRYVAALMDLDTGDLIIEGNELLVKGIQLARRDFPSWVTSLQLKVVLKVLKFEPFGNVIDLIIEEIDRLMNGEVDYKDLIAVCSVNSSYKSKTYKMALFTKNLKDEGKPAKPGTRLDYLVVDTGDPDELLGKRMRLPESYLEKLGTSKEEKLDYKYYVQQLENSIGQIISICYQKECAQLHYCLKWRPTKRHNFIFFSDPIKVITKMVLHGYDYHEIIKDMHKILCKKSKPKLNLVK